MRTSEEYLKPSNFLTIKNIAVIYAAYDQMNILFSLLVSAVSVGFLSANTYSAELVALNDSAHASKLYRKIRDDENALLDDRDPVILGTKNRAQICEEMASSGYFNLLYLKPVSLEEVRQNRDHDVRYLAIHNKIQTHLFLSEELYAKQKITVLDIEEKFDEYVFPCVLKSASKDESKPLIVYYVSRVYNVGVFCGSPSPGRFLFMNEPIPWTPFRNIYPILAEEPAEVYAGHQDFDLENYYRLLRRYIQPVETSDEDPLCRLISDEKNDFNNQHYRFCVAVSRSAQYKEKLAYPVQVPYPCVKREVSFRSTAASSSENLVGSYTEFMTKCYSMHMNTAEKGSLFISRAYQSGQILVYRRDPTDRKIYLEHLFTNVKIVDEINSFDFVEY